MKMLIKLSLLALAIGSFILTSCDSGQETPSNDETTEIMAEEAPVEESTIEESTENMPMDSALEQDAPTESNFEESTEEAM